MELYHLSRSTWQKGMSNTAVKTWDSYTTIIILPSYINFWWMIQCRDQISSVINLVSDSNDRRYPMLLRDENAEIQD